MSPNSLIGQTTLFVGTMAGKIFKITDAGNIGSSTITPVGTTGLPVGSISCIEFGVNDIDIIVSFYNYGNTFKNLWYSNSGGVNAWINIEGIWNSGGLPYNMPVRWVLWNPINREEVLVACELGIFKSINFLSSNSALWQTTAGIPLIRTDMIRYRASDNQIIAATHGRGLYSNYFNSFQARISTDGNYNETVSDILTVQPNPGRSTIFLTLASVFEAKVEFINQLGQVKRTYNLYKLDMPLSIETLEDGLYQIKFTTDNELFYTKFLKE